MAAAPPSGELVQLTADDLPTLWAWAESEGWNPGIGDLRLAFSLDPEGFLGLRRGGELVASLTAVRHGEGFGFLGFFIVDEALRGEGIGGGLLRDGIARLQDRLDTGSSIGMDGVFDVAPWYASLGFVLSHRDLRFEGELPGEPSATVEMLELDRLDDAAFADIVAFDTARRELARPDFLRAWMAMPEVVAGIVREGGEIVGLGVLRPTAKGRRFGPLLGRSPEVARSILLALVHAAGGGFVQVDVPESNAAGVAMAESLGLVNAFGCARMYLGPMPELPWDEVYGVTSFEFG